VEGISDHALSSEDTDTIPEKTDDDDDDERQVEDDTLVSSLDDNASAETNEATLAEDSAVASASNEEPTLLSRKPDKEEEGEPSLSDDSQEMNESSPSATPDYNDPLDDTLIKSLAEGDAGSMVSIKEETLHSEKPGKDDKPQLQETTIPVSKRREDIAVGLIESKTQIPHFYLQCEINAGPLLDARIAINKKFSDLPSEVGGFQVTINDLVLKASAEAITWVPEINASWAGDHIKQHGAVHLGFSVAVEDGLITPVIHDAETKRLRSLSIETKQLISKARTHKLSPEEMSGSTFTVTNLGMYGVDFFSGIINPPNAAILSVGATNTKPIVDDLGRIVPGRRMMLGLSCDHRVVDGAIGSSYLKALAEILENPTLMLV
jgi:pyruvate/2-oxoglutarate dehydrogenase complex dihydrolipoamide acyltransferase (E2) component